MFKVILTSNEVLESINNYSIECGAHDGKQHFDHHKKFSSNNSPANNGFIKPMHNLNTISNFKNYIFVSHIDCDTFLGLNRLLVNKYPLPMGIDFSIIEEIDLNGDSILGDIKFISDTHAYYVGIGALARKLNFPRVSHDNQDVTEVVTKMFDTSKEEIIKLGKGIINQEEETWDRLEKNFYNREVLLIRVPKGTNFNPSSVYKKGVNILVVYRDDYKTISIYANPSYNLKTPLNTIKWGDLEFAGHEKACGSPRGEELDYKLAEVVASDLSIYY